jgi:hypothetical protein
LADPFIRHALSTIPRFEPNLIKIPRRTKVLRNSNRICQIQHCVPPTIGNKDCFSLVLSKFVATKASIVAVTPHSVCPTFDARKNRHEILNGFIILIRANEALSFDDMFGDIGRKENPSLFAMHQCIPGTSCEWINMHRRAGTFGSDQEPPVGRSTLFTDESKQVIPKVRRNPKVGCRANAKMCEFWVQSITPVTPVNNGAT